MTAEYLKHQQEEHETMLYWTAIINENPEMFKQHYKKLGIMDQCRLRAFIQIRDSKLYTKMLQVLGEE